MWHLHLDVILWIGAIAGLYWYGAYRYGPAHGHTVTRWQAIWFYTGTMVTYIAASSPIHDLGEERLFAVHMTQHMLFSLVAAPFFLMGMPGWMFDPILRNRALRAIARVLTKPMIAFTLFNAFTMVSHMPFFLEGVLRHHPLHFGAHLVLMFTSLLMWWPVLSNVPTLPRMREPLQMIYLFAQSLVPTVLASFYTFATSPIYTFYEEAPRIWGISASTDQLVAGLIMKLGGGAILWVAIGVIFFVWVNREERNARVPAPLLWEDVEAELDRMGLTGSSTNTGTR